jgi:hypothetical protein
VILRHHTEIAKAFSDQVAETREIFRAIGCSGKSGYEDLPYYRCAAQQRPVLLSAAVCDHSHQLDSCKCYRYHLYWHLHVAHALIYGVIKTLWKFLLRIPSQAGIAGVAASHIILPNAVKATLSSRARTAVFKATGCISGQVPDVVR